MFSNRTGIFIVLIFNFFSTIVCEEIYLHVRQLNFIFSAGSAQGRSQFEF